MPKEVDSFSEKHLVAWIFNPLLASLYASSKTNDEYDVEKSFGIAPETRETEIGSIVNQCPIVIIWFYLFSIACEQELLL